jgi:hypothetical protein
VPGSVNVYVGSTPPGRGTFPLAKSASLRYLQTAGGTPFFMIADSPQAMFVNIAATDRVTGTDAGTYLTARKAQGFNALWVNILCVVYTGGRSDGSTFDGLLPFNSTVDGTHYDLTTPNTAYWARMDAHVALASSYGLCLVIDPIETGGWKDVALANGTTRCTTYGHFLGSRYAGYPNICWMSGNDYAVADWSTYDPTLTAVADGIRANMPNALQTVEVEQNLSVADMGSLGNTTWASRIDIDAAYVFTDRNVYSQLYTEYNRANGPLPVVMVEATYENENATTVPEIRRQAWWTLCCGSSGYFYGEHNTSFLLTGWQNFLGSPNSPGADYLIHLRNFTGAVNWQTLVPDQAQTFLTSGFGTSGTTSFATAAKSADGHLAVAFTPFVTNMVFNLSAMAGSVTAQWYDPTHGTYTAIGSGLTGSHTFTHPGNNFAGSSDWVLLLQA